ncbi:helix-turn-helix domain-containing protein [Acinetobacter sp. 194]|uniref:helix-turn-helix domain-containing protein n=1 Tax=Acinetobacter shaoyimingii TaxID=2715164 RepID=UPI00140BE258|nr:helix-turn-helix domain-containing protein [Acinetobacter shaoyimingii]NHB56995.1 helix-turn-helix domain-containing protein [Acinetobacter shaoyimingii]
MDTNKLRSFFYGLSKQDRESFAKKCNTSVGMIVQIINKNRSCHPTLAIDIDRESKSFVLCDELCPRTDFEYLRQRSRFLEEV